MRVDPVLLIEGLYEARRRGDLAAATACCHDDILFVFNADPDRIGSGDRLVGIQASVEHLATVAAHWETLEARRGPVQGSGSVYSVRIWIKMKPRNGRTILEGTKTHIWTVFDDKIAKLEETMDKNLVHAVQRLSLGEASEA